MEEKGNSNNFLQTQGKTEFVSQVPIAVRILYNSCG